MTQLALLDAALKPAYRNSDAITSVLAAEVAGRSRQRLAVLGQLYELGSYGATDWELGERLGIPPTSSGKRRLELQRLGLVEHAGTKRPTGTGCMAFVWRLNEFGRDAWYQQTRRNTEEVSVGEFL